METAKGERGVRAPKGPRGPRGTSGKRGPKGTTGASGKQGSRGLRGFTGASGLPNTLKDVAAKLTEVDRHIGTLFKELETHNTRMTQLQLQIDYLMRQKDKNPL